MIKAISYSLFGDTPKYLTGMLENIKLASRFYPDWEVWVYYNNTVPREIVDEMERNSFVILTNVGDFRLPGMFWRFLSNADIFIVRDADSRIANRDVEAVKEWLDEGTVLHIMRDHPHHKYNILGGMWGMRKQENFNMLHEIVDYIKDRKVSLYTRGLDMFFLSDIVYQRFKYNSTIHASFHAREKHAKPFPSERKNFEFVGEIYDENNKRNYQYNLLKE